MHESPPWEATFLQCRALSLSLILGAQSEPAPMGPILKRKRGSFFTRASDRTKQGRAQWQLAGLQKWRHRQVDVSQQAWELLRTIPPEEHRLGLECFWGIFVINRVLVDVAMLMFVLVMPENLVIKPVCGGYFPIPSCLLSNHRRDARTQVAGERKCKLI